MPTPAIRHTCHPTGWATTRASLEVAIRDGVDVVLVDRRWIIPRKPPALNLCSCLSIIKDVVRREPFSNAQLNAHTAPQLLSLLVLVAATR